MKNNLLISLLLVLCSMFLIYIYIPSVVDDFYFFFRSKEAKSIILDFSKINGRKPHLIKFEYYNEFLNQKIESEQKVEDRYFQKIKDRRFGSIDIIYTSQSANDVYFVEYKVRTIGAFVFRSLIFLIIFGAFILFVFDFFKKIKLFMINTASPQ